jgi:glycosyltransferase involved in cell wall biosynthesis
MQNEVPIGLGNQSGLSLDLANDKVIYCLQPTRVIYRKHIDHDLELLQTLLKHEPFVKQFKADPELKLVLHITGPTPIEHKKDLEDVLNAYIALCNDVSLDFANRVFLIFSVGNENHACFEKLNFKPLCIESIYQLADVILFPSETEGRGLPIIESSAGGVPIICNRYYPEEVFAEVVGENLPDYDQIKYLRFPPRKFSKKFLDAATDLMLHPDGYANWKEHNRNAVRHRYSVEMLERKFKIFFKTLAKSEEAKKCTLAL